jgi:hypothetical protein
MEIPLRGVGGCGVVFSWYSWADSVVVVTGVVWFPRGVSPREIGFFSADGASFPGPANGPGVQA